MVVLDSEAFLQRLQMLYARTKKWGTVRVQIKRAFQENHHFKKSKRVERANERHELSTSANAGSFGLVIKAATSKVKLST